MTSMQEQVQRIQTLEQNLQQLLMQKRSLRTNLIEIESALEELDPDSASWRMIGNIMVKTDPEELITKLQTDKERLSTRIDAFAKQEQVLQEKLQELQEHVMEHAERGKD